MNIDEVLESQYGLTMVSADGEYWLEQAEDGRLRYWGPLSQDQADAFRVLRDVPIGLFPELRQDRESVALQH